VSVLYEDLRIELNGISFAVPQQPGLKPRFPPDFDPADHAVSYFLRRSIATLHEFGDALLDIDQNPEFQTVHTRFHTDQVDEWNAAIAHFRELVGKKGFERPVTGGVMPLQSAGGT
jgi:hypothetical protein